MPALAWLIITIILLVMPGSDVPTLPFLDLVYFDKWVHIGMFGVLTFLWSFTFLKTELIAKRMFVIITIVSILYGVMMEFVQKYFAFERDFDLLDMVADSIGSILAFIWLTYLLKWKKYYKK